MNGLAAASAGGGAVLARLQSRRTAGMAAISAARLSSCSARPGSWSDESPEGGLTRLYVYRESSRVPADTVWPDARMGVLGRGDPRFGMPGNVGVAVAWDDDDEGNDDGIEWCFRPSADSSSSADVHAVSAPVPIDLSHRSDLLARPTNVENQAQTLYTATDFIQHTPGSESAVCADVLDSFPSMANAGNLACEAHEAPRLLRKEVQGLFPDRDLSTGPLSVLTLAQKTLNDMSMWSEDMEEEREKLCEHFVAAAKEICARLKAEGYWADFVCPTSGKPYYGPNTSTSMFETDEKYRLLGFRIEDLGCCKVISHRDFGRHVFVGSVFTNTPASVGVIEDLFLDLRLALNKQGENC